MPWLSIIIFLLSFVLSKAKGKSTSEAALVGLAAGGATYLLADPTNPDNLFGVGQNSAATGGTTTPTATSPGSTTNIGAGASGTTSGLGGLVNSLGPTGTALIAGGTGAVIGASLPKWVIYAGLGLGAYLLIKD